MLKTWIEKIKKAPKHYGVKYWKYSYSNNMLELSVSKDYREDENDYRNAIISIGKVLQALRQNLTKNKVQHHIQIFPNFDDSSLIAAIRTFPSSQINPQKTPADAGQYSDSEMMVDGLKNYAIANQLSLKQLSESDLVKFQIKDPSKSMNWFVLCADHENPFTWLRVGYWHEFVNTLNKENPGKIVIVSDSDLPDSKLLLNGSVKSNHVQLVVGIDPTHK